MTAHNTFDNPQEVKPAAFNAFSLRGDVLTVTLPSKSVVVLEVE
jgi:alpha-N-arabinofuranosidase